MLLRCQELTIGMNHPEFSELKFKEIEEADEMDSPSFPQYAFSSVGTR